MCWEDFLAGLEVSCCRASEKEQRVGFGGWFFLGDGENGPSPVPLQSYHLIVAMTY